MGSGGGGWGWELYLTLRSPPESSAADSALADSNQSLPLIFARSWLVSVTCVTDVTDADVTDVTDITDVTDVTDVTDAVGQTLTEASNTSGTDLFTVSDRHTVAHSIRSRQQICSCATFGTVPHRWLIMTPNRELLVVFDANPSVSLLLTVG